MKASELKLRAEHACDDLIDVYYGEDTLMDKMVNSTLKVLVKTNIGKMDDVLKMFEDVSGEIDAETIVSAYADQLTDDGAKFDIRKYIKNEFIRNILPDKYLIVNREDILKIIQTNE